MTTKDKRLILRTYTELLVKCGYDISWIFGIPLNKWEYDEVKQRISELEKEYENQ